MTHEIRIEDKFVLGSAKIHWHARERAESLPLLDDPAVLTRLTIPRSLKLVRKRGSEHPQQLVADANGTFDIEVQYQLQVTKGAEESDFTLPVRSGLVNRLNLTVLNADVDVLSPQAVSVEREIGGQQYGGEAGARRRATIFASPGSRAAAM